jgi:hypothetical protein
MSFEGSFLDQGISIVDGHGVVGQPDDQVGIFFEVDLNDVRLVQSDGAESRQMIRVRKHVT